MWPAHLLTLSRIPIAIGFWWASGFWAVALVAAAALTDTLDGNLARWLRRRGHDRPDIGGWLDPVVDKLFVVIVVVALWRTVDPLILLLLATREILLVVVAIMYLARAGARSIRDLHADRLGKVATVAQFLALAIVLVVSRQESRLEAEWGLVAAAVAGVLGFAAAIHYWRAVDRMHKYTRPASQRDISTTASSAR